MLRTLLALAGLLLFVPATASADPFGELPFLPVKDSAACVQATGAPGEFIHQTESTARLLMAGPAGITAGVTLPTDGALDCADVAAWPGGGGLLAFPVAAGFDDEVWVRGFLREPGQPWGEAIEILPPQERLAAGDFAAAASERGDALVAMSTIDRKGRAAVRVTRRLPGGTFGAPESFALGRTTAEQAPDVRAGYGASGEAVVTWTTKGAKRDSPAELWAATAAPGAPFGAPQKIADVDAGAPYALAVGADGRALAVFSDGARLLVAERSPGGTFGATSMLARALDGPVTQPVAILRPDGGAIVAWRSVTTAGMTARTRAQPGPFAAPLALVRLKGLDPATKQNLEQRAEIGGPTLRDDGRPQAALAADGRVLLTWNQLGRRQGIWRTLPATALLDFSGGAAEVHTYGGALRDAESVAPVLLADGSRAVAWADNGPGSLGRIHLAREGTPDTPDAPAPKVTVTTVGSGALKIKRPRCD